jgi:hypothetical protein
MARQSYDLQLTRYGDEGWRATFYPAGGRLLHAPVQAASGAPIIRAAKNPRVCKDRG